ncbi:chitin-binding protein, partial [Enterococcus mundtii]|nr:chitin-binding protein [Enterococcus mundtii]
MKKINLFIATMGLASIVILTFGYSTQSYAHGYVNDPVSRVKNAAANGFGWGPGQ